MAHQILKKRFPSTWILLALVGFALLSNSLNCLAEEDVITEQESALLAKLKPMVKNLLYKDYMKTDQWLVRFLRARRNDLSAAKEMIANTIKWRKENKIDSILLEDLGAFEDENPMIIDGFDRHGHPILIQNIGAIDTRKVAIAGRTNDFFRMNEWANEAMEAMLREIAAETGQTNVTRIYVIMDAAGFNLRQHACVQCLKTIPRIMTTLENHYPDGVYRLVGVNTPKAFVPVFELVREFMSERSKAAITLLDHDSSKWKSVLLKDIPEDQLPRAYGGTSSALPKTISQLKKSNKWIKLAVERARREAEEEKSKNNTA